MDEFLRWVTNTTTTLAAVLVGIAIAGFVLVVWRLMRLPPTRAVGHTARDLAVVAALAVIVVPTLLSPLDVVAETPRFRIIPFEDLRDALVGRYSLDLAVIELVGNVAIFMPLGMALRWRFPALGVLQVGAVALGASVIVEVLQALTGGGQWPETTDVITNTAGGLVGAALAGMAPVRESRS